MSKIPEDLVTEYAHGFFGYGSWEARTWFVGMEEGGGKDVHDVRSRLELWNQRKRRELEDLKEFHLARGDARWHGDSAQLQPTWKQLIRMHLMAHGKPANDPELLAFQRGEFGRHGGSLCSIELFPLPSPGLNAWHYARWSALWWLQTRQRYQNFLMLFRACAIRDRIQKYRPRVVIFYGSSWHSYWGMIAGGGWEQAIQGRLMGFQAKETSYYVTRHPVRESDGYFEEIGRFLSIKHGEQL